MASVFDDIRKAAGNRDKSINWYRTKIRDLGNRISASKLLRGGKVRTRPRMNELQMFFYDPKFKRELPYYDRFPLVLPIESYRDGFLGINFHYLPQPLRIQLLERLDARNFEGDYSSLKRIKLIKPCIKRYLTSKFKSGFLRLDETDYLPAVLMPVAQFQKASESRIFADSRRRAR